MILANDFSSGLIRFQKLLAQMANRVLLDLARAAQIHIDSYGFALRWPCVTLSQNQCHWKWDKMIEDDGMYKHGG